MNLQEGDVVRYLNAVGGGTVQKIIDDSKVEILDDSGFAIPVFERELVLVERPETKKKEVPVEPAAKQEETATDELGEEEIEGNDNPHLFFAFVRDKKDSSLFEAYLINDCNYHCMYVLAVRKDDAMVRLSSGLLEANTKIQAAKISYEDLSHIGTLCLQGLLFKKGEYAPQQIVDIEVAINPVKFYKPGVFVVNDFFDEDAYVLDVYDAEKERIKKEKDALRKVTPEEIKVAIKEKKDDRPVVKPVAVKPVENIREVELHIQELTEDPSLMTPAEMLELQVSTFEKELGNAAAAGLEKIVFIHGVGNGILKAKIRGSLDRNYPQYFYQDASYAKYKFGATLVYLRKVNK